MTTETFFTLYERFTNSTEVPPLFHKWCAICGIAATLGKNFYFQRGHFKVYPNQYVMLLGSPGTGKGSSINILQSLLLDSGYSSFAADKSSKEKFLADFQEGFSFHANSDFSTSALDATDLRNRDSPRRQFSISSILQEDSLDTTTPKEVFIVAEEFNDFIGQNNADFISLLTKLWSYSGVYRNRLKTSKSISIYEPCVNILGGNTASGFSLAFPPDIMGQGFLARLIPVYGEPTGRRITFPIAPDAELRYQLSKYFSSIRSNVIGEASISDDAKILLDQINQKFQPLADPRFQHYTSRRLTHLIKLCLICAASRLSCEIKSEDVKEANTILVFTEDLMSKAIGEFGKARTSEVASRIMEAMYVTKKPLTVQDLWKLCSSDLATISDLANVIAGLVHAEKIQPVAKGYLPKHFIREQSADVVSIEGRNKLFKE